MRTQTCQGDKQQAEIQWQISQRRRMSRALNKGLTNGDREALHPRPQTLLIHNSNTILLGKGCQLVRCAARTVQQAFRNPKSRGQNSLMRDEDVIGKPWVVCNLW